MPEKSYMTSSRTATSIYIAARFRVKNSSLPINCLYSMRTFSAQPFAWFFILYFVPLMASYFFMSRTFSVWEDRAMSKVYHRTGEGKRSGFTCIFFYTGEGQHCWFMPIGLRRCFCWCIYIVRMHFLVLHFNSHTMFMKELMDCNRLI
jgi:hypothetical protein